MPTPTSLLLTIAVAVAQPGAAASDLPMAVPQQHANRLVDETSPYLLQHAHNPVNWYPWGPQAFKAARAAGKPIFLSIGYSTCYWCHVMERESFENEAIAAIMNEHFVSIKVDREERPDVDDIYMAATQIFNQGQGGWPMSVFLEPETLKPFIAGTYFPPTDSMGRPGFTTVLTRVAELWADKRPELINQAEQVALLVGQQLSLAGQPKLVGPQHVDQAITLLLGVYDADDGGFGGGGPTKFPMPAYLDLLIGAGWDRPAVRTAVTHTLDRMAMGGMYDQVGGGFHRYSTDRAWLVPHFEKMLYDNGQLASTYARACELTGDPYYARVVRQTLDYVLREMTDASGACYSAQDAEVNAREGGNYVWTAQEARDALVAAGLADDVDFALEVYGLSGGGNFRDPHHPQEGSRNVLYLSQRPDPENYERLDRINAALLAVRDRRDQPATDDKVLTGWNGLMIAGLADGGRVLGEPRYVDAAVAAGEFLLAAMRDDEGGLLRAYRAGRARVPAPLEDYGLLIRGMIALHRATDDTRWLQAAVELTEAADERFRDDEDGAYYDSLADRTDLFVRGKSSYDGAVPCGNSTMLTGLIDLYELTDDASYLHQALSTLNGISAAIDANPVSTTLSTLALARLGDRLPKVAAAPAAKRPGAEAVSIKASTDSVEVGPDEPSTFELTLTIEEAYHINAHEPGQPVLIGLEVQLVGAEGLEIQPAYPAGDPYRDEIRIHSGSVTVPVEVRQIDRIEGEPRLIVTYQVCTDTVCLAPQTEVVAVKFVAR